jgi:uncharacterized repeat protein (TIGR01451 family)
MKPSTLHNLKKLMLVIGLALSFGLLTVSSTLATSPSVPTDLAASAAQLVGQAGRTVEENAEAPVPDRVVATTETAPPASQLDDTAAISPAGSTSLVAGALNQDWGDFDRDGYLDLALGTANGISIYHNLNGRLVFSTSLTSGPGYGVRWADINDNGLLELITVKNAPGANSIYRYSAGSFVSYTAFNSAVPLARVVVLSGTRDLIASSSVISTPCTVFHYHKNLSNNTFTTLPTCVAASASAGLSAADYDGDGDSDLILGSFPHELLLLVNHNRVLTTTSFPTQTNFFVVDTTSSWPYDFAWGDYDGDKRLDLAAAYPLQRQIRIYHNDGGSVAPLKLSGILPTQRFMTPLSIDWGDFDGDGALDLAVADDPPRIVFNVARSITATLEAQPLSGQPSGDTHWSVRAAALDNSELSFALSGDLEPSTVYGTVGGHLRTEIEPLTTAAANSLAWGDTSGDGRLDLLLGAYALPNNSFLYPNVNGALTTTAATPFVSGNRQSVAIGKLDRKSDKQLGLIIGGGNSQNRGYVNVYTRTTQLAQVLSLPSPVGALALGDFNNDGWLDLLVGTRNANGSGTLLLYRNNQTTFDTKPVVSTTLSGQVQSVAWGDINPPTDGGGNRFLDFAVATSQQVYIYRNDGNNTFTTNTYAENLDNRAVAWGDFDQDGDLDLAVGVGGQGVWLYLNNGNGASFNLGWTSPALPQITSLAAGDWNNDGWLDLAVGNAGEPDQVYANLGQTPGDLSLLPVWAAQDTGSTTSLAWGDVNSDGYLDLAVSRQSGANGVYYNTTITPWPLPTPPTSVFIARPGKTFDAYLYSSSEFLPGYLSPVTVTLAQTATIYYTVANPLSAPITNTQLELSLDGGSTWQTPFFTRTQVPNQTAPAGQGGRLTWNAWEDQAFSDHALFRIRVVDQSPVGPFQRASSAAVSPPFRVRAMTCQWLTGLWIEVKPSDQVQPLDTVTFNAKVSDFSGGTISYTWTIIDGGQTTIIDEGYSQINYIYENAGRFPVRLRAQHSRCTEGPPLEAVTYVQVGSQPVSQTQLYLPLIQRSGTTAQADASAPPGESHQPRAASVAAALGGQTMCLPKTIFPGTRPTVDWLSVMRGAHGRPALNHDGSRFAFWSTANLAGANADGNIELYYAQVDQPRSCVTFTQITSSTGSILEGFTLGPALNAAGDRLAFFSDQNLTGGNADENFEIFFAQIDAAGGITVSQVTNSPRGVNALPTLNAAGDRVAFVSDQNYGGGNSEGNQEIYLAATPPISGQGVYTPVTQTSLGTFNDEPALSSDGDRLVFVRGTATRSGQDILTGPSHQAGAPLTVTASSATAFNYQPTIGGSGAQYTIAYATTYVTQEIVNLATISGAAVNIVPAYTTTLNSQPSLNVVDGSRLLVVSGAQRLEVLRTADGGFVPVYACAKPDCLYSALSGDGMHVTFVERGTLWGAYYETATLGLTLTQPSLPVVAGAPLTRAIVLNNSGPGAADDVVLLSTLRNGLSAIVPMTVTTPPGSVCSGSGPLNCRIPSAGINSTTYITLQTLQPIDAAESGPLTLAAEASAWQAVTTTMNPSLMVEAESDLQISKRLTTTAVAGELVTYTLTITNGGPSRTREVTVTDRLPDDLDLVSYSSVGNVVFTLTNTANWITGTINHMNPHVTGTIQITAQIKSSVPYGRSISNTGIVTSAVLDPVVNNNSKLVDFAVTTRASLTLTKSAPVTVTAGLPLTYTIVVTSTGPSTAYNVLITDTLPASVTVASVPIGCASLGGGTQITCTVASLATGSTHSVEIAAHTDPNLNQNTTLTNHVAATASNATPTRVVTNTATTAANLGSTLAITKTATVAVTAGEPLTYTITVVNNGPSKAPGLTLRDVVPTTQISYTGWSAAPSWNSVSCSYVSGTVMCVDAQDFGRNENQTLFIYAVTNQSLPIGTAINNTASVTATSSPVSVTSQATTVIGNSIARLTASKSANATALAGTAMSYTIIVTNSGPSAASHVTVTDQLPAGVTYAAASPGCTSVNGTDVQCLVSNLLVGPAARHTFIITGNVAYSVTSGSQLLNLATITASNAAATVNVSATTEVRTSSALALHKTATEYVATVTDPVATGEIVTYTLVVTNSGPSLARHVVLTDVLPVSVTYLSQVSAIPLITPTLSGHTLTWSLDPIAPNSTNAFTFTGRALTSTVGPVTLTNRAGVTAATAPAVVTATADTVVLPRARLALTKTLLTPQPVVVGNTITYQIVLQNLGPSTVLSATITDDLPSDVVSGIQSAGPGCLSAGLSVTCTTSVLEAGESHTVTLVAPTTRNLPSSPTFTNTAFATSTIAIAPVNSAVTGTTVARAQLYVTKTLVPLNGAAVAGHALTYSVTVGNGGPSNAPQVNVIDELPEELLTPTVTPQGCTGPIGRVVTCTVGSLNVGSTWSFTVSGQLSHTLAPGLVITNTAQATTTIASSVATNVLTSTVVWRADLRVSKLAPATALSGAPLVYTIIVINEGPSVATTPIITDHLPISLTYISQVGATPAISEPLRSGQLLTWTLAGSLAPSATQIITFTTLITDEVDSADYLTNTAYATAPEATSVATGTASTLFQLQGNLILTKTVLNPNPVAGGPITYGITVTNLGPSRMRPVIMTDVLPSEVTLSSWSSGCVAPANSVITCTRNTRLSAGSSWVITLTGQITSSASSPFINTAYATATIATALANDSVSTTPLIQVGLQVTKTATPTQGAAGELITYTILAGNRGPSDASTAIITDRLPAELTFISATPGYQLAADVITFTLSNLRSGQQRPVTITGRIDAALPTNTVVTNTAYLSSPLTPTIASSQVTRTITTRASLSVTKLAPAMAPAGTPFSYTLVITNDGPSVAPTVQVTDQLPISLTYLSQAGAEPALAGFASAGQLLTWTLAADMTPLATQIITFNVQVTDNVDSLVSIANTAYASTTIAAALAEGSAVTQLQPRGSLALTKTVLTANPIAGSDITYGLTVTNLGPSPAPAVTITDDWPVVIAYTSSSGCTAPFNSVITCTGGSLAVGASWEITIAGRITSSASAAFTNTAYATSPITTAQVSSSISTTPGIQVSVHVTKSADLTVLAGNPLTYTLYVTNSGPSQASIITLTDYLPVSLTVSALPIGCSGSSPITCVLTDVGVGAANSRSVVLTPTVDTRVVTGTPLVNTVVVTSSHSLNVVTATVTTTAQSMAALRATQQAAASVIAGNPLTYTIYITNDGPSLASGLVVTDQLPVELSFSSATAGCTPDSSVITCATFGLDKDAQQLITVTGQVSPAMPARVITNTAYVSSTVDATWLSRTVTTTVTTAADLQIGATITPTSVVSSAASEVRVTIVFTNSGPSDAQAVYITGTLNALTYTTEIARPIYVTGPNGANCSGGSTPHQCSWTIATLTGTLSGVIEFTATTPITTTTAQLTAEIASAGTSDPAGGNTATTNLSFAQAVPRLYWAGLLFTRWPLALIGVPPRDFWSQSP